MGNFYLEMIQNNTNKNFVTSDGPIINLCANYSEIGPEYISGMELYYPVSPKIAIICKYGSTKNVRTSVNSEEVIDRLNLKMFKVASR